VTGRLAAAFLKRPAQAWVAELGPLGASVVRVNRGLDLPDDPHVKARGLLQRVSDILVPRSPIRIRDRKGERPPAATFPPPAVGAHTRAVLEKTGLDAAAIDDLVRSGAIGEPR
jgi:alpha-methylacyl-CoA racemase